MSGTIMAQRKPSGEVEIAPSAPEVDPGLLAAAEDLIKAIEAKDAHALVSAMQAAIALMQPQEYADE